MAMVERTVMALELACWPARSEGVAETTNLPHYLQPNNKTTPLSKLSLSHRELQQS